MFKMLYFSGVFCDLYTKRICVVECTKVLSPVVVESVGIMKRVQNMWRILSQEIGQTVRPARVPALVCVGIAALTATGRMQQGHGWQPSEKHSDGVAAW